MSMLARKIRSRAIKALTARVSPDRVKAALRAIGYDPGHWVRTVMYRECFRMVQELGPERLDAMEISAGSEWRDLPFRSFTPTHYPDFDICQQRLDREFDLIIADQVFEHLLWPYRAARNVHAMLRPGGHFLIATPFLVRIHEVPTDCTRWTEQGLRYFLAECGFDLDGIRTGSWGNRACVKANFTKWARQGWFGSLRNEPQFPVTVWALAKK
jgi:SAM-dependent methyltransferase